MISMDISRDTGGCLARCTAIARYFQANSRRLVAFTHYAGYQSEDRQGTRPPRPYIQTDHLPRLGGVPRLGLRTI